MKIPSASFLPVAPVCLAPCGLLVELVGISSAGIFTGSYPGCYFQVLSCAVCHCLILLPRSLLMSVAALPEARSVTRTPEFALLWCCRRRDIGSVVSSLYSRRRAVYGKFCDAHFSFALTIVLTTSTRKLHPSTHCTYQLHVR